MKIIGGTQDFLSETQIVYAQVSLDEYLNMIGEDYGSFSIQRRRENHKAYGRLKTDIQGGASLPTITLALKPESVEEGIEKLQDKEALEEFLSQTGRCNILDGLQRTYILDALKKDGFSFKDGQKLLLEIWFEQRLEKLIYRIIVLNAGQKPMSVRHQIELLFSSLQAAIARQIGGIELLKEKDSKRRRKAGTYPLQVIVSGYQAFVSGTTELDKENLISQHLQVDTALEMEEKDINEQFHEFVDFFRIYSLIDEQVNRVYDSSSKENREEGDEISKDKVRNPHWLANENTCISFFASIAQFSFNSDEAIHNEKRDRTKNALRRLIELLKRAENGDDPLCLDVLEAVRMSKSVKKINVGTYTRRLLSNGLKEYYRADGDISLERAWNLAVD